MKLDPRHLVQLATILDSGTLRVAAKRLGTTQPALSRTIAMMEERIGTPLFERSRRPLTPTDTGIELAAFGRSIRSAVERADNLSREITDGQYGTIRVGAPPFMCDQLISRIVGEFARTRPQVRVVLHGDYFPALVTALHNHRLDIVIGPFELLERPGGLAVERVLKSRNVIVCRPGHKMTRQKKVTIADFESATWIGHSRESMLSADLRSTLADLGVDRFNIVFESDLAGAVLTLVHDDDYLTVLPLLRWRSGWWPASWRYCRPAQRSGAMDGHHHARRQRAKRCHDGAQEGAGGGNHRGRAAVEQAGRAGRQDWN